MEPRMGDGENWTNWKFGKLNQLKICVSGSPSVDRISALAIMQKLKTGCHFVNIDHTEKFQITNTPKFGSLVFWVSMEMEYQSWSLWKNWKIATISYQWKTGYMNFLLVQFSEFFIGSVFPVTHPRFHFNIYAWLYLKYAWTFMCGNLSALVKSSKKVWSFQNHFPRSFWQFCQHCIRAK